MESHTGVAFQGQCCSRVHRHHQRYHRCDEENEFGLVIKKFHKFMHKEYEQRGKKLSKKDHPNAM
ncbi:unnamed protein product, partial [Cuscuta campestris]